VDRLAELAGDGQALEFAIGTGRVAIPLAQRGVPVTGIELSEPMIEQLHTKAGTTAIPVIAGDMATARAPGAYTLVYLVYNAISCLLTQAEQVACFGNAARHLTPGGRFVIELSACVRGSQTMPMSFGWIWVRRSSGAEPMGRDNNEHDDLRAGERRRTRRRDLRPR
jgi:SAM-dependent methyltransferase